jgi:hypothetical protein
VSPCFSSLLGFISSLPQLALDKRLCCCCCCCCLSISKIVAVFFKMCTAASYSYIHVHFIMICKVAIEDEYLAAGLCSSAIRRFEIRAAGHPTAGSRWGGGLPVSRKKRPHVAFRLRLRLRSLPFPFVSLSPAASLRPQQPPPPFPPSGKFPNPPPKP